MYNENNSPCICEECGCVLDDNNRITAPNGADYCEECYYEIYTLCAHCGYDVHSDNTVFINDLGHAICEECAETSSAYFRCDDCGEWYSTSRLFYCDDDHSICFNCSDYWRECSECGDVFHVDNGTYDEDEEEWYCDYCAEKRPPKTIHEYGYKPLPDFLSTPTDDDDARFYGLELEVDNGDDAKGCATLIEETTSNVYMKHDGSLRCGFEIVSHPATLNYHMTDPMWDDITKACRQYDFLSHNTSTCGLHIHIGREQLPTDAPEKLLIIFETHWEKLVTFSRRDYSQLESWACKPEFGAQCGDDAEILKEKTYKHRRKGRYQAVNLMNSATIEIRVFRGTLRRDTIIASIQLLDVLLDYCETHTTDEVLTATWEELTHGSNFRELNEYMQGRGL